MRKAASASLILYGIKGVVETYVAFLSGGISEEARTKEKVTVAGTDVIRAVITVPIEKGEILSRPENRQGQGNLGVSTLALEVLRLTTTVNGIFVVYRIGSVKAAIREKGMTIG